MSLQLLHCGLQQRQTYAAFREYVREHTALVNDDDIEELLRRAVAESMPAILTNAGFIAGTNRSGVNVDIELGDSGEVRTGSSSYEMLDLPCAQLRSAPLQVAEFGSAGEFEALGTL